MLLFDDVAQDLQRLDELPFVYVAREIGSDTPCCMRSAAARDPSRNLTVISVLPDAACNRRRATGDGSS